MKKIALIAIPTPNQKTKFAIRLMKYLGGNSGTGSGLLPVFWSSFLFVPTMLHNIHLRLHIALTTKTTGRSLGTLQKEMLFWNKANIM
jgi:hypothetical protein